MQAMQRFTVIGASILVLSLLNQVATAQLTELAWYRLGEDDPGAVAGGTVETAVESLEGRDMFSFGDVTYSDDTPPNILSELSVEFDGEFDNYLRTEATAWHELLPNFRVGMEAWIKVDPSMEGTPTVPFGNGTGYHLSIDEEGYVLANAGNTFTPIGVTPIRYGEWEHVAFWSTGSFWQVYLNGVPQLDPTAEFNYGTPSGDATIGSDREGFAEYIGLVDEHRVFTWTGAFNPTDLNYYSQRAAGDVNENGVVDQEDYDIWRANVGSDVTGLALLEGRGRGDLNGDRIVDLDDFAEIKANLSPDVVLVVPEPTSLLPALMGIGLLLIRRRRRT